MVISNINQGSTQSVIPFGSFNGASGSAVTSVLSNNKPSTEKGAITKTPKTSENNGANGQADLKAPTKSNEKGTTLKTPKVLINNVTNGQSALKPAKRITKSPQPKTSNHFRLPLTSPATPELNHASKSPSPKPSFDFSLLRGASVGSETPFARRIPLTFEPEKPLPPIFSIFD